MLWAVEGFVCQGGQLLHGEVFSHGSLLEHLVDYGAVQHLLRTAVKTLQTEETENTDTYYIRHGAGRRRETGLCSGPWF